MIGNSKDTDTKLTLDFTLTKIMTKVKLQFNPGISHTLNMFVRIKQGKIILRNHPSDLIMVK